MMTLVGAFNGSQIATSFGSHTMPVTNDLERCNFRGRSDECPGVFVLR